jgi:hypothetical protein
MMSLLTALMTSLLTALMTSLLTAPVTSLRPEPLMSLCVSPPPTVSFLGVMCCRVLLNHHQHQGELLGECPLPAVKVSLDWLRLRPSVFQEGALHQRQQ